jgi:hypothetical protein
MSEASNIVVGAATFKIDVLGGSVADVGYTKGGVTVRYEPEFVDVMADSAIGLVKKVRSMERLYVTTTFLEVGLLNLKTAFGQPASNLSGTTSLDLGYSNICGTPEFVIQIIGQSPQCGTRTFNFAKCVAMGTREITMSREEEVSFEVEFEVMKDSNGNFGSVVDS